MDIMELGAIGELFGGIAVIGSLVFVGFQIRANTRTLRAEAATRSQVGWAELNRWISEHPHHETLVRFLTPSERPAHFESKEASVIVFVMRSFIQELEAQFFQYRAGLLHPEVWEARTRAWASLFLIPSVSQWWQEEKTVPIYTRSFLAELERAEGVPIDPRALIGRPVDEPANGGR